MALMKCPDCGKMVSSRASVCPECGCPSSYFEEEITDKRVNTDEEDNETEIVEEEDEEEDDDGWVFEKLDHFSILGQEKYYDKSQKLYIDMMKCHNGKAAIYEKELKDRYVKAKTMEKVWDDVIPWVVKTIDSIVNENIKILYEYDIYISATKFKEKYDIDYWNKIKNITKIYDSVMHEANEHQQIKEYERAGRSRWQGGGFGLRGAVSGAIKAGMLNAVTDAGRAIGDSIVDSCDSSKVTQVTQNLYNDKETQKEICWQFRQCIIMADMGLAIALEDKGLTFGIGVDSGLDAVEKWVHAREYEKNKRKLAVKGIEALYGFPLHVWNDAIINDIIPEVISSGDENSIDDLLRFMKFWEMQNDFSQFFFDMEKRKVVNQYLESHDDYKNINFGEYKPHTYVKLKLIRKELIQVTGSNSLPQLVPFCVRLDDFFKRCLDTEYCLSSAETVLGVTDNTTVDDFIERIHNEKLELEGLLRGIWIRGDDKKIPDAKIRNKWKIPEKDIIFMYQNEAIFGTAFGGKGFVLTNTLLCNLNPSTIIPLSKMSDIRYNNASHTIIVSGDNGSEIIIDLNLEKPASRRFLFSILELFFKTYCVPQEIEKGTIEEKTQTIFCPYCGKKIIRTTKFCNFCGKANKYG